MAMKSYQFRFYPTQAQIKQLEQEFGCARFVWNHCLSMRNKAYQRRGDSLNYVGLSKHLTHLKTTSRFAWLKNATAGCLTQKLIDLDKAFAGFFKQGLKHPRFKKKAHGQALRYQLDQRNLASTYAAGKLIKLPKLGALRIKWSRIPAGIPQNDHRVQGRLGRLFHRVIL
jgi:putative transposase